MPAHRFLPRVLPLVCLSVLWPAAPASAQSYAEAPLLVNEVKLRAAYGGCFGAEGATENCDFFELAVQFPLGGLLNRDPGARGLEHFGYSRFRPAAAAPAPRRRQASPDRGAEGSFELNSFSNDMHRPPPNGGGGIPLSKLLGPADEHENTAAVEHGGTDVLFFNLNFPLLFDDDFLFEPFAGAGVARIRETDDPEPRVVIEARDGIAAVDYGLRASVPFFTDRVLLQAQYRRVVLFPKDLTYLFRIEGREVTRVRTKVGATAVGSVSFGLAVGLF